MARRAQWVALLLAGAISATGCAATWEQVPQHTGYDDVSYFYDDLAPYGTWVDVAPYGAVWCPEGLSSAWQPYTIGYWVATDDGWLWASEDPWGGVPYHYGRWAFDDFYGWVWVPGDIWAPSWVAWRYGSGWVGWAPLPPDVSWYANVGIRFSGNDLDRHIDTRYWSFTKAEDFGTHRKRVRVERSEDKTVFLKQTRNVTQYAAGPRPVEEGMRPDLIREIREKKIERYRIVDAAKPVSKQGIEIRGRQVEVFRPRVDVGELVRERDRVRAATQRKNPDPEPRAIERAGRKQENPGEPELRIAKPRVIPPQPPTEKERKLGDVALEPSRRQKSEAQARNEIKEQDKRVVDAGGRQVATRREEIDATARGREEAARQREEARNREGIARQRAEAARQAEADTKQREQVARTRERNVQDGEKDPPNRNRVEDREDRVREKSDPPAEPRERRANAPEGRGSSKARTRGN
jgi:hypothetical protein